MIREEGYIIAGIILILGMIAGPAIYESKLSRFCLAHGYPRYEWRIIGPNYCITRINQTDVVVSVKEVK